MGPENEYDPLSEAYEEYNKLKTRCKLVFEQWRNLNSVINHDTSKASVIEEADRMDSAIERLRALFKDEHI